MHAKLRSPSTNSGNTNYCILVNFYTLTDVPSYTTLKGISTNVVFALLYFLVQLLDYVLFDFYVLKKDRKKIVN